MDTYPTPAPPGFAWLKNRTTDTREGLFDGAVEVFKPLEAKLLPLDRAVYLRHHAILQSDFGTATRWLVGPDDPEWHDPTPLNASGIVELVDRSSNDNPLGAGTGGLKTKATVVPIPGSLRSRAQTRVSPAS